MNLQPKNNLSIKQLDEIYSAIDSKQAVVELTPNGQIIYANKIFLKLTDYTLDEIYQQPHKIFCEDAYINSSEYKQLWDNLKSGKSVAGEFKRLGKNQKKLWISANYTPILNSDGEVFKVIKFLTLTKEAL